MAEPFQDEVDHWIDQIRHIDELLEPSVDGLIELAQWNVAIADAGSHPFGGKVRRPMYFPAWLTDEREPRFQDHINLTTALCIRVLQRLSLTRRRFPRIEKKLEAFEASLRADGETRDLPEILADGFLPPKGAADPYRAYIKQANLMADWHPFSTANILWVLLRGGESKAYTGAGLLALFAILWSMHGSEGGEGAAIGMLPASAYVTNVCITAIRSLLSACARRAQVVKQIAERIEEIDRLVMAKDHTARFPFLVDGLLNLLFDFRHVAITGSTFEGQLRNIENVGSELTMPMQAADAWRHLRGELRDILANVASSGKDLVTEFGSVRPLLAEIESHVREASAAGDPEGALDKLRQLRITVPTVEFADVDARRRFWQSRAEAATRARGACDKAMGAFEGAVEACALGTNDDAATLARAFRALQRGNEKVIDAIAPTVDASERWCVSVVMREIANASSGNWTEFDPAELAGALEVATVAGEIESPRLIADAVVKAAKGLFGTGGWVAGQPFMLDETFSVSAVAPAADVIFILTRVLRAYPELTDSDEHLLAFVEWLAGTRTEYTVKHIGGYALERPIRLAGWVSERQARPRRVDLWNTALIIDALLGLRSLFEDRLWALCERRFTIIDDVSRLEDVQATDLGAPHGKRLHRRLAQMARATNGRDYKEADYSLVLHGPPGSSKTKIVGAVASELWRMNRTPRPVRLIRVTPADFTHRGEALVDFEARSIFKLLSHLRRVTVLFDEIDDLLRRRMFEEYPSFLKLVVPAMLNRLQDLRDACARQEICFILATNYIDNIEPALLRKGRIDEVIPLVYPDLESRAELVDARLLKLPAGKEWTRATVRRLLTGPATNRWPYKELDSLCRAVLAVIAATTNRDRMALVARVTRLIVTSASASRSPYDAQRLENLAVSEPFRYEFLTYLLSGVGSMKEFKTEIRAQLHDVAELAAWPAAKRTALTKVALGAATDVWQRHHSE
jgi:hypothetical protein